MHLLPRLLLISGWLISATAFANPAAPPDTGTHDLRVMTFNVRYSEADDGINA